MSEQLYMGLHHVSIVVTNIDEAKHFYGEILGVPEGNRPPFDFPGAWYELGSTQIHLIVHDDAKTLRHTQEIDTKDGHFAVRVHAIEPIIERLEQHQIAYRSNPTSITGWHQVFVTDPSGNVLEFNA